MYINSETFEIMCPIDTGYGVFEEIEMKNGEKIFRCNECGLVAKDYKHLLDDIYSQNDINESEIKTARSFLVTKEARAKFLTFTEFNYSTFSFKIEKDGIIKECNTK